MTSFLRDLRYAVRLSLRSPVTVAVAVLALALGIGVNASSFVLIESMILNPLPYPRLDRIMTVWETPRLQSEREALSPADYVDLKSQSTSFDKMAAYREAEVSLTNGGSPERVQAFAVTGDFFAVLGKHAKFGQTISHDDADHARVAVVSEGFWKSHLAGSPNAVGQSISLSGRKYTVIGVMPDDFDYPLSTDVWLPLVLGPDEQRDRSDRNISVLALLKPDVTRAQANAETASIATRLASEYPRTNEGRGITVVWLRDMTDTVTTHFLWTLLGGAGFVLLLACANIGNLQMARAAVRQKEITVRAALGASRFQIARQLLAESILIALIAGFVGLMLASWNNALAKSGIPAVAMRIVPGLRNMHVDATVVLLTIGVSLLTGIVCSLPAIFQLLYGRLGADLSEALRERSGNTANAPRNRLRTVLIVSELALALVLLVGAGLMVTTFQHELERDQGFNPKNLLTMEVSLPSTDYRDAAQMRGFYDRALAGLGTLSGVKAAGLESVRGPAEALFIEGRPEPRPGEPRPTVASVNGHFLQAMSIPVLEGRSIGENDRPGTQPVVVLSESIAQHYWPHANPIGRRVKLDARSGWLTVAGVCGDVKDWFSGHQLPAAYVSYAQFPAPGAQFLVRTTGDPIAQAHAARSRINAVDPDLPVYEVKTMQQAIAEETSGVRAAARMMVIYAVIALLLAITGVYAVFSYFVAARTHDIGVRMALGAGRAEIFRMIMSQTARLVAAGLAVGIPLAWLLSHAMASALYNVIYINPGTFAAFSAVLAAAALLASYLPSRRAMRIDPMTALRDE